MQSRGRGGDRYAESRKKRAPGGNGDAEALDVAIGAVYQRQQRLSAVTAPAAQHILSEGERFIYRHYHAHRWRIYGYYYPFRYRT